MPNYRANFTAGEKIKSDDMNNNFELIHTGMFIVSELLGTGDAVETDFDTTNQFVTGSTAVYVSGLRLRNAAGAGNYTESGNGTIVFGTAPAMSAPILIDYIRLNP